MRGFVALVTCVVVITACGSGTSAPDVEGTEVACAERFCVTYPTGWSVLDQGGSFLSFSHPDDPEQALATVSTVNMRGAIESNGGTWPASPQDVVETFWASIDGGEAELGRLDFRSDGAIESFGAFQGGRMWLLLHPTDPVRAAGIEVRGPNSSWEEHARIFLDGLELLP